jgi:hypothetical protein
LKIEEKEKKEEKKNKNKKKKEKIEGSLHFSWPRHCFVPLNVGWRQEQKWKMKK